MKLNFYVILKVVIIHYFPSNTFLSRIIKVKHFIFEEARHSTGGKYSMHYPHKKNILGQNNLSHNVIFLFFFLICENLL